MNEKQIPKFKPPTLAISTSETEDFSIVNTGEAIEEESEYATVEKKEALRELKLKNDALEASVTKMQDDNAARLSFGQSIFAVVVIWMFLMLVIVWSSGSGKIRLSDTVLVALITTTTANFVAILLIVVNYLFNRDKST